MRVPSAVLASLLVMSSSAIAQQVNHAPAQSAPASPAISGPSKAVSPPSRPIQQNSDDVSWMTNKESVLAGLVLLFGSFLAVLQAYLMVKREFKAHEIIRLSGLTFIVISTLFIITAGYGAAQIAPAMGLFGTLAGYILGRTHQGGDRRDADPH